VNHWPFLPQAETGRHRQHDADGLDYQGPLAKVSSDDESTEDCFNLQSIRPKYEVLKHVRIKITVFYNETPYSLVNRNQCSSETLVPPIHKANMSHISRHVTNTHQCNTLTRGTGFNPRWLHLTFAMDKLALGQDPSVSPCSSSYDCSLKCRTALTGQHTILCPWCVSTPVSAATPVSGCYRIPVQRCAYTQWYAIHTEVCLYSLVCHPYRGVLTFSGMPSIQRCAYTQWYAIHTEVCLHSVVCHPSTQTKCLTVIWHKLQSGTRNISMILNSVRCIRVVSQTLFSP
jgi:hypothetical protein